MMNIEQGISNVEVLASTFEIPHSIFCGSLSHATALHLDIKSRPATKRKASPFRETPLLGSIFPSEGISFLDHVLPAALKGHTAGGFPGAAGADL
jgi:hypothetical protein